MLARPTRPYLIDGLFLFLNQHFLGLRRSIQRQEMHTRYEIVVDPFDRYMIWDRWRQTPAEWAGEPLVGLNGIIARAALNMLNSRARAPVQA